MNIAWIVLLTTTLAGAPADEVKVAVDTLVTCDSLRDRECLVAAARLNTHGDEAIAPLKRRIHRMPQTGQLLALSVIDGRSGREGTEALLALAVDRRIDPAVRALAVDNLSTRAHKRINDRLLRALRDRAPVVRVAAARVLSSRLYSADKRILEALLVATDDAEAAVRIEALFGCGFSGAPAAGPALVRALADPLLDIRRAGVEGLGVVSHPPSVDGLIRTLSDSDALVVRAAARALAFQTGEAFGDDRSRWESWRESRP